MLLTPHTFIGIAVAASIPNPYIAVPVALLSHFLGDLIPHWDFYTNTTREERKTGWIPLAVMGDMGLGIALGTTATLYALWILGDTTLALSTLLCGIASVLPDALTGPSLYIKDANIIFRTIHKIQSKLQTSANMFWGNLTQIAAIVLSILVIKNSLGL